jgi:hypothetical protein
MAIAIIIMVDAIMTARIALNGINHYGLKS